MPRISGVTDNDADPRSRELLNATQQKLGMVPNLFRTLAHSPAALEAYLTMGDVLANGELTPELREKVALTMAGANRCGYCASAHTAVGKSLSIETPELTRNLVGESDDYRTSAILSFVKSIVETRGAVDDADLAQARAAGVTDAEMAELVANIALHVLTNYLNRLAQTEIDFPFVELGAPTPEALAAVS